MKVFEPPCKHISCSQLPSRTLALTFDTLYHCSRQFVADNHVIVLVPLTLTIFDCELWWSTALCAPQYIVLRYPQLLLRYQTIHQTMSTHSV